MSAEERRLVSLVPSITETLLAWGVRPVAVTRFCDAEGIATVGGTKNPDIEAIVRLAPDAVLMDEEENRKEDAEELSAAGIEVVATAVRSLNDVAAANASLARAAGVAPPDGPVHAPAKEAGIRAWVPIWRRPWMTIGPGTYGTSILEAAGVLNVFTTAPATDRYPTVTLEEVAALRPDVVLAPSEPYPFKERHREELERVAPVRFVDGRDLFWWGSRTAAALERLTALANCLSP